MVRKTLCLSLAWILCASFASARKNDPNIELEFVPQQAIAGADFVSDGEVFEHPVRIRVSDSRPGELDVLGTRTDDDDDRFILKTPSSVADFVSGAVDSMFPEWGLTADSEAPVGLHLEVVQFKVVETNQAVGATYEAKAILKVTVEDASGTEQWSGSAVGDATRYGKKFSSENTNEVLSDALLESLANILSDAKLQDAWVDTAG